jgi:hypothetical protein
MQNSCIGISRKYSYDLSIELKDCQCCSSKAYRPKLAIHEGCCYIKQVIKMGSRKKVEHYQNKKRIDSPMKIDTQCFVVDKQGLASHLDVSLSTIDRWIKQGMPYIERGGFGHPWRFNVSVVRLWKMRNKK